VDVDDLLRHLFLHLDGHPPAHREGVTALVRQQDLLLRFIDRPPQWVARLGALRKAP
jgi:hypothetical protein